MATFDQLVTDAQPALMVAMGEATEGRSWDFSVILYDADGDEYDMPTLMSGGTGVCEVLDDIDGAVLVTMSVTFPGGGQVRWTAAPGVTADIGGTSKIKRRCPWHLTLTNSAARQLDVFGVQDSRLVISQGE